MSHKLLLVEDDDSLGATLKERLEKENYVVDWEKTFSSAKMKLESVLYDLVLLDVGLPDGNGFDLAKLTRSPFLFMTAMNTAENRLDAYEMGAQEFIPKPFHLRELLIRVQHVLDAHPVLHVLQFDGFSIDMDQMKVFVVDASGEQKQEVLQSRDYQLLKLLIEEAHKVHSRDEILDRIWGEDKFPSNRTVDNAIVRLRQIVGNAEAIRSVRGVGYQWALTQIQPQS